MTQNEKRKQLIKVAKMYYYGHMTQQEISEMLQTSRSKIARMLIEAEQLGIVQITVRDPFFSIEEAQKILKGRLNLKLVRIVPSAGNYSDVKNNIGVAASELLNSRLSDSIKIGISWGTTVNAFVNAFHAVRSCPDASVVQLVGGMYSQAMHMDGRELARTLAGKLKCSFSTLQMPMFVHNPELKALLLQEPETQRHFELMRNLDIAFVGIGSSNYKESIIYKAQFIEESEAKSLYAMGLCDICGHQIDQDGVEPDNYLSRRLIGIPLEYLRDTPLTVGICSGSDRSRSILSAVKGHYLHGLIIDEVAAISLLEALGVEM